METKDNPSPRSPGPLMAPETGGASDGGPKPPQSDQADQAHRVLVDQLRDGTLRSGMFLSMPMLVTQLGFPLAAVREAVKRAEAAALVTILPKRGVMVMNAYAQITRDCIELRALLDTHGARRLLSRPGDLPLAALRASHEAVLEAAQGDIAPDLQRRAILTDVSLHDALALGLDGPILGRLYAENRDRIAVIQHQRPFLADRIVPAMVEHLAILSALEAGDMALVQHRIQEHLSHTLRWWGIDASGTTTSLSPA